MKLPYIQSADRILSMLQTQWAAIINPIISAPQNNSLVLQNISLASGANLVNHKLGQKLQGWKVVRQRSAATIYDTQDSNPHPELTLSLVASAPVSIDLEIF